MWNRNTSHILLYFCGEQCSILFKVLLIHVRTFIDSIWSLEIHCFIGHLIGLMLSLWLAILIFVFQKKCRVWSKRKAWFEYMDARWTGLHNITVLKYWWNPYYWQCSWSKYCTWLLWTTGMLALKSSDIWYAVGSSLTPAAKTSMIGWWNGCGIYWHKSWDGNDRKV